MAPIIFSGRLCTDVPQPCLWLPLEGLGPTPTDSEPSWNNRVPSDCSVAGESTAQTLLKRSNTIEEYVASPISPYLDDVWSYAKLSMTKEDAWDRRPDQVCDTVHDRLLHFLHSHAFKIKAYIAVACLRPNQTSTKVRKDLICVWSQIIAPAL